jgi:TolB-like protein/class 3 adenylate cyclase/Flp pilus assembly protein TadD
MSRGASGKRLQSRRMTEVKKPIQFEIGHVLFMDIVGYSKLLINQQSELLEASKKVVRGTEQFRIAQGAGKLLRLPTGDGGALVFRTTPEAPVLCALEIAKALKSYPELRVRMGIHSGPVNEVTDLNEQANIAGAGINIAQRVMDCGDAGHILLSKHVAEDLEQYGHWQPLLHDLGECEVKHGVRLGVVNLYRDEIGNPQLPKRFQALMKQRTRIRWAGLATALLLLAAIVAAFLIILRKPMRWTSNAPEKSIAVLPFENLSEDKANAYFADGIQEEILTRLSQIADLKVISRTSTQHYKSVPEDLPEIGRQLGVAHILEGSVQKSGDAVRVNVQLIKAANDSHLWADTYDRRLTDIFSVESEVAKAIADQLRAKLTGPEEQVIAAKPTENVEAHDAYLRGIDFFSRPGQTPENLKKAATLFAEAVRLDPKFAQAWAGLSRVNARLYFDQIDASPSRKEAARTAAETATRLNPTAAETLLANAYYRYHIERDYNGARELFEKLRLEVPSNSEAIEALARIARRQSRWKDSLRLYEEAAKLNPRDAYLFMDRAWTFSMLRDFSATEEMIDRALAIIPDEPDLLVNKAWLYRTTGNLPAARAVLDKIPATGQSEEATQARVNLLMFERRYDEAAHLLEQKLARTAEKPPEKEGDDRQFLGWLLSLAGNKGSRSRGSASRDGNSSPDFTRFQGRREGTRSRRGAESEPCPDL